MMTCFAVSRVIALTVLFCFGTSEGSYQYGTVYCKNLKCNYKANILDVKGGTASGTYNDTLLQTGWGILDIISGHGKNSEDNDIMYAAGFLEGYFTYSKIYDHYQNMEEYFLKGKTDAFITKLKDFVSQQVKWTNENIESKAGIDPLWRHVGFIMRQFDGLVDGYKAAAPSDKALDVFAFQILNLAGDLLDLVNALEPKNIPDWRNMSHEKAKLFVQQRGMCSALVKVLGGYENLFMSHSSWFIYQATSRIYKHYNFNVQDPATAAQRVSFSSYPGFLESLDDFYLLSSNMVMLQTTNSVFNESLYQYVVPQSLFAWQRVRVANMMAHNGKEWAAVLSQFNSGTYNNQYMIIDMNKIHLKKTIEDGALWVVEQIPTLVKSGDQTSILRTGYWPSYNVPFYEEVYNKSGYPEFVAKHGNDYTYQLAPRAKIFRRDEGKVVDMTSMKGIMRYNDYQSDPYSEGDACNQICCRGDLKKMEPGPFGCYDTKVSDYFMAQEFKADIINGPTIGTGLSPFSWTTAFNQSHVGLPETYNFDFLTTSPKFHVMH